ncbi:MAG: ECF-type sigma factor [Salinivenus sp.]
MSELLAALRQGSREVEAKLVGQIHGELRRLARGQRKRWKGDPSLRTTALAHEAYLKLVGPEDRSWENRSHFLAVAAKAMRHVLINEAERRCAQKRGGDTEPLSLEALREELGRERPAGSERADEKVIEGEVELTVLLDKALDRFEEEHPRAARGVECRFFGGMTIEETAEALGVSAATVSRDWAHARAWLYREMEKMRGEKGGPEKQT